MLLFRQRNLGSIKLCKFLSVAIDGQDTYGNGIVSAYMEDNAMRTNLVLLMNSTKSLKQAEVKKIINCINRTEDKELAIPLLEKLLNPTDISPSILTMAFQCFHNVNYSQGAFDLYHRILKENPVVLNDQHITTLLKVCKLNGNIKEGLIAFQNFIGSNFASKLNNIIASSFLSMCASASDVTIYRTNPEILEEAFKVLELLRLSKIPPHPSVYSPLILLCGKSMRLELAKQLYQELSEVYPNNVTARTALMSAASHAHDYPFAFEVFENMIKQGIQPNTRTVAKLLEVCNKSNDSKKGLTIFLDWEQSGAMSDLHICKQVLFLLNPGPKNIRPFLGSRTSIESEEEKIRAKALQIVRKYLLKQQPFLLPSNTSHDVLDDFLQTLPFLAHHVTKLEEVDQLLDCLAHNYSHDNITHNDDDTTMMSLEDIITTDIITNATYSLMNKGAWSSLLSLLCRLDFVASFSSSCQLRKTDLISVCISTLFKAKLNEKAKKLFQQRILSFQQQDSSTLELTFLFELLQNRDQSDAIPIICEIINSNQLFTKNLLINCLKCCSNNIEVVLGILKMKSESGTKIVTAALLDGEPLNIILLMLSNSKNRELEINEINIELKKIEDLSFTNTSS